MKYPYMKPEIQPPDLRRLWSRWLRLALLAATLIVVIACGGLVFAQESDATLKIFRLALPVILAIIIIANMASEYRKATQTEPPFDAATSGHNRAVEQAILAQTGVDERGLHERHR